jgi:flagellar protein FlaG
LNRKEAEVVDISQRIEQVTNASPVGNVHDARFTPPQQQREAEAATEPQTKPLTVEDKVELQIEPEAIRQLQPNTHLKFVVSEDSARVIVQIIQSDTNQVLREVPPKSLSDALAALNGGFGKQIR